MPFDFPDLLTACRRSIDINCRAKGRGMALRPDCCVIRTLLTLSRVFSEFLHTFGLLARQVVFFPRDSHQHDELSAPRRPPDWQYLPILR